jgi:hypothetical protein
MKKDIFGHYIRIKSMLQVLLRLNEERPLFLPTTKKWIEKEIRWLESEI